MTLAMKPRVMKPLSATRTVSSWRRAALPRTAQQMRDCLNAASGKNNKVFNLVPTFFIAIL